MMFDSNKPCPCGLYGKKYGECCEHEGPTAMGNAMLRGTLPVYIEGTRTDTQSSMVMGDTRLRFLWHRLWNAPQEESFHVFLDKLVEDTLGKDWFERQRSLAPDDQNVVVCWRAALLELVERPADSPRGVHIFTGPVEAYMHLGYDLYWLLIHYKRPDSLVERLKTRAKFQGARYEVLVAAVFTRAGFNIEWFDDDKEKGKHCEFIAKHKQTGTRIGVGTKSRQRSGALHFKGQVSLDEPKADIFERYEDAVGQVPTDGTPSLIFIDANWRMTIPTGFKAYAPIPPGMFPWVDDVGRGLNERWNELSGKTAETAVVLTNYAYYFGSNYERSPVPIVGATFSPKPNAPINDRRALDDLFYCLLHYDQIPRQI